MILTSLSITGFRSFAKSTSFSFDPHFTLIIGPNSVGKTNLLEAVYFLAKGQGFRERKVIELVNSQAEQALIKGHTEADELEVRLSKKEKDVNKHFFLNGLHKPYKEYRTRTLSVVLFQPNDLLLISGTPSVRRQYFDRLLSQTDYEYYQAKNNFERGLYKRNYILEHAHNYSSADLSDLLQFWDEYLGKQIDYLVKVRSEIIALFNKTPYLNGMSFRVDYENNPFIMSRNHEQLKKELRVRRTLSGPQLDEFVFYRTDKEDKNLGIYGSRSEQRLAVLWLKVNELKYFEEKNERPLLLMDDIFSELDEHNSERILKVALNYQTIVTTAHLDVLPLLGKRGTRITLNP